MASRKRPEKTLYEWVFGVRPLKEELYGLSEAVRKALATLPPREERILRLRLGIDEPKPLTLREIGKMLNLTGERVRQLEAKALRNLRQPARASKVKCHLL